MLSEIDHALAVIGTAHWIENFSTGAHPRDRRQSTSTKWQLWGMGRHRGRRKRVTAMGHEGQFALPKLSGRSAFSEETFAGRCGNGKMRRRLHSAEVSA